MMNQNNPQNDPRDAELDGTLRKMAKDIHPRPAFVSKLRGELETQAAHPRRSIWDLLTHARPWLAQAVLIAALAALVLIAGTLTGRLFAPDHGEFREIGANLTPSGARNASDALPAGALARLGKGKIQSIDAVPDGRIAVGSTAGLCVYNSGLTPDWCRWTDAPVHAALFDPTGTRLAVRYGTKPDVEIWDAALGQVIASREFAEPSSPFSGGGSLAAFWNYGIAWEPVQSERVSHLAITENSASLSLWNWQQDTLEWGPETLSDVPLTIDWAAGPAGESILAVLTQENAHLFNGQTGERMGGIEGLFPSPLVGLSALDFATDGARLAVAMPEGIYWIGLDGFRPVSAQPVQEGVDGMRLSLSSDNALLAAQMGEEILTYDPQTGQDIASIRSMPISPVAWNPADGRLYYASPDGSLASFDGRLEGAVIVSGHTLAPQFAAWREDGTLVTAANRFTYTWDAASQSLASFGEMTLSDSVYAAGLSKDGTRAVFFDPTANRMIVWDVVNNQPLHDFRSSGFLQAVTLSSDGAQLAAVNEDGQILTWKLLDNGSEERDVSGIRGFTSVDALAFHPGGDNIAVAYTQNDGTGVLEIWSIASQTMVIRLAPAGSKRFSSSITSLAWSEDALFLGATQGQQVWVWDVTTMQPVPIVPQPDGNSVYALATLHFHPTDRDTLVAADNRVHYLPRGEQALFGGHALRVNDLAFHPDGEALASASNDGTVILWNLGDASLPLVEIQPTATPISLQEYTVVSGDTCSGIAYTFGISVESLISLNNLSADCSDLVVGQVLRIPYPTPTPRVTRPVDYPAPPSFEPTASVQEYKVVNGDTCGGIAFTFNISAESLIAANNLASDCSNLVVGQVLIIPYPTPTPFPTNTLDPYPAQGQGTPSPTPTRTTMPGQPTPLPDATQHPFPDTKGYEVTQTDGISASGKWRWIAIRGEWMPGAPREEDLNFIIAASTDGMQTWVLEEWTPHGLGEGRPTGFTFSADDHYLYFFDLGNPDGCGPTWQTNLRRMDLQNGIVSMVPLSEETLQSNFAFSPGASRLALVTRSHIEMYDLAALQMIQQLPIPFSPPPDWSISFLGWQPDSASRLLAFEIVSPPESLCGTPESEFQRWTVVTDTETGTAWSYSNPPGYTLHTWSDYREGGIYGRLIYQSLEGSEITVNPRTGEVIP